MKVYKRYNDSATTTISLELLMKANFNYKLVHYGELIKSNESDDRKTVAKILCLKLMDNE